MKRKKYSYNLGGDLNIDPLQYLIGGVSTIEAPQAKEGSVGSAIQQLGSTAKGLDALFPGAGTAASSLLNLVGGHISPTSYSPIRTNENPFGGKKYGGNYQNGGQIYVPNPADPTRAFGKKPIPKRNFLDKAISYFDPKLNEQLNKRDSVIGTYNQTIDKLQTHKFENLHGVTPQISKLKEKKSGGDYQQGGVYPRGTDPVLSSDSFEVDYPGEATDAKSYGSYNLDKDEIVDMFQQFVYSDEEHLSSVPDKSPAKLAKPIKKAIGKAEKKLLKTPTDTHAKNTILMSSSILSNIATNQEMLKLMMGLQDHDIGDKQSGGAYKNKGSLQNGGLINPGVVPNPNFQPALGAFRIPQKPNIYNYLENPLPQTYEGPAMGPSDTAPQQYMQSLGASAPSNIATTPNLAPGQDVDFPSFPQDTIPNYSPIFKGPYGPGSSSFVGPDMWNAPAEFINKPVISKESPNYPIPQPFPQDPSIPSPLPGFNIPQQGVQTSVPQGGLPQTTPSTTPSGGSPKRSKKTSPKKGGVTYNPQLQQSTLDYLIGALQGVTPGSAGVLGERAPFNEALNPLLNMQHKNLSNPDIDPSTLSPTGIPLLEDRLKELPQEARDQVTQIQEDPNLSPEDKQSKLSQLLKSLGVGDYLQLASLPMYASTLLGGPEKFTTNLEKMRQIDVDPIASQIRQALTGQLRGLDTGSYNTNQAQRQAAYSQYYNSLRETSTDVANRNRQLAAQTDRFNIGQRDRTRDQNAASRARHRDAIRALAQTVGNLGMAASDRRTNQEAAKYYNAAFSDVSKFLMEEIRKQS